MPPQKPFAPVHVDMAEHPKVAALSDRAFRAHVRGILYANRLLTDGRVPSTVAEGYGRRAITELVSSSLWAKNGTGYIIHDFPDWNSTRADVEAKREMKAAAGRARAERMLSTSTSTRPADAQQKGSRRSATRVLGNTNTNNSGASAPEHAVLWATLAEACGYDQEHMLDQHRRFIGKQATALAKMHADPEVVVELADIIRELRHRAPTPALIVNMYPQVKELRDELDAYRGRVEMAGQIARRRR